MYMKSLVRLIMMLAIIVIPSIKSFGQAAQFKAMYLYKFAKGVQWPNSSNGRDLVITVVGDNEMASALKKSVASRKIGSRGIIVQEASTITQVQNADMVFLGESKSDQIQKLIESQNGNNVLIVAGKGGWCEHGAGISFVNKNGALAYEVSVKNMQKFGLSCSQEILRSGTNVD